MPPTISRAFVADTAVAEPVTGHKTSSPDIAKFASRLTLPVLATRLPQPPSREMAEVSARSNAGLIGFLLHEVDLEAMPRIADERLAAALAPLCVKLDLLIELVARLSYRDIALPSAAPIELSAAHIAWRWGEQCQRGDWLRLDIYFHQVFREPVTLFAAVTDCDEPGGEHGYRIAADLFEMPQSTQERLLRLAFLTQRQQQTRQRTMTVNKQ